MADAITQTIQNHFEFSKDSGTGAESMEQVFSQLNNTNNHHHHQHHHHQHHHHQQQQQNGITETSDDSSSTCSTSSYTSSNTGGGGGYLNGTTTSANTLTNIVPTVINLPSPTSSSPLQSKANNNQQQTQQQQQQQQQPSSATAVAASTAANTLTLIPTPKPYPLHEAAFKGEYDKIVSLLLFTQGKKVGSPNHQHSSSANHRQDGPIDTSKMDFTGVNSLDDKKTTPLHHAAFNGHKQCVKLLLASSAYSDVQDIDGCTPLHNAAFNGYKSVMAMLLDAGSDPNTRDIDQNTALHKTAYSGFHKCAELLIQSGADIEARDAYGITPLLKSASNKHYKCLLLLIEKSADVNAKDYSDSTALHQSCYKGSDKSVSLLIQKGASVNVIDKEGYTPLHNAVFNGFEECSRILLDKGANIDQRAMDGCTALIYSASNGFENCVSLLTRRGCKLDIRDEKRGRTALHFAASKGNIGCVEILLKAGADPNSKDINGKTPKNLTKIPEIISVLSAYEEQKKKSKSKSKSKRNSETVEQPINKDQQTTTTTQPQINSINSSSNSSSSSNNNNNKTAEININSSNNSVSSSVVTKQKWDVNIDSNSSPTSVSMVKEESSMQSPTSSTTQSSPHSNASLSRAGSTDSLSGEKESPENTPKLDIYGFVKTTSTVDESTIRTKKTDKQEKKWAKMTKNWPKFAKSAKLRDRLPKGIPSSVRSFVWQRLVNIQEIKNKSKITYSELLQMKPQPAIASQIQRDLNRTFPKHSFFVEKGGFGQQILCNILTAFSIYNPEVGYCQGMGFITCLLIIYMAEEDAFWVLVQLAEKYGMAEMWKPDFPYLQTSFGLLNTMLEQQFPQLFAHIQKQNVFTPLFSSQWFICLLIYNLPFPVIVRIWDLFLYDGLVVIFASALALFKIYEDQIMKFEFEEILNLLKFANGEEKSLRIDVYQFMKLVVHYKHKIKHFVTDGQIKDPNLV